jgi:hypothetical protein
MTVKLTIALDITESFKFIVLIESKDYERRPETITMPPAHVALRCDIRLN